MALEAIPDTHARKKKVRLRLNATWLIVPGLVFLLITFMLPLVVLLSSSVYDDGFTLKHYVKIFTTASYLQIIWRSIEIALLSTSMTIIVSYPVSYYLTQVNSGARTLIMAMIIVPFWTNILVRCYSWIIILQKRGVVNTALTDQLAIFDHPLNLVYNLTGVLIGMIHFLIPPAILILYSVNQTIDLRLTQAARSLGATSSKAFMHVFLPISMPGVRAATLLIMILSLGFFVTPALLGGRTEITLAMLIDIQFSETINWSFGAALSTVLLLMTLAGIALYYRAVAYARLPSM
jgi:putative spermidine/putrescine transport system permease protein